MPSSDASSGTRYENWKMGRPGIPLSYSDKSFENFVKNWLGLAEIKKTLGILKMSIFKKSKFGSFSAIF